jgi:NAD(P)-dependent dehydrogenase (short-subunit alcohol dehydrogenase family)
VLVNDVGGSVDGRGGDAGPAKQVADEIAARGGDAVAGAEDISSWDGAERTVGEALASFGRLDVVVNNAGILRDRMLPNMSEEEWDAVIRVHLKGTFAMSRHASAHWRDRVKAGERNDARIVNTSSVAGLYANVGQTNYGAAKAAIAAFTQIAAQELARYGVTVNAIAPGALTRMTEGLPLAEESRSRLDPRWVASVCVWLASPLSADVTGQVIEASGLCLAVAEGWRRGPTAAPVSEPREVDAALRRLLAQARPRTTMAEVS